LITVTSLMHTTGNQDKNPSKEIKNKKMKTSKLSAILSTLFIVIFLSLSGIANPATRLDGDVLRKSANKNVTGEIKKSAELSTISTENEFSYLRFDVNKFSGNAVAEEVADNSIDYLRFDVSNFVNTNSDEISELQVSSDFDYLRFNVNNYTDANTAEISEMPVSGEFDYLRFDVNKYDSSDTGSMDEMLIN